MAGLPQTNLSSPLQSYRATGCNFQHPLGKLQLRACKLQDTCAPSVICSDLSSTSVDHSAVLASAYASDACGPAVCNKVIFQLACTGVKWPAESSIHLATRAQKCDVCSLGQDILGGGLSSHVGVPHTLKQFAEYGVVGLSCSIRACMCSLTSVMCPWSHCSQQLFLMPATITRREGATVRESELWGSGLH